MGHRGTQASFHAKAQPPESGCDIPNWKLETKRARVDLVFEISERGKACPLLGTVRPATAKRVEGVAVERVQLACAAGCQFKSCDEFHCFLRLSEALTTGAFLAPDTEHHGRKGRVVGGR